MDKLDAIMGEIADMEPVLQRATVELPQVALVQAFAAMEREELGLGNESELDLLLDDLADLQPRMQEQRKKEEEAPPPRKSHVMPEPCEPPTAPQKSLPSPPQPIQTKKGCCAACGKRVEGGILACEARWHAECFQCTQCHTSLLGQPVMEVAQQPYCVPCHSKNFVPSCSGCSQSIQGQYLVALEKHWHPNCFVCIACHQPFQDGEFVAKQGQPWCTSCAALPKKDELRCLVCSKALVDQHVEAEGHGWCSDHFVCVVCHKGFSDLQFYFHDDQLFCREHR